MKTLKGEKSYYLRRDLKIDDSSKTKDPKIADIALNSVTNKFIKEPVTLENLEKKMRLMNDNPAKAKVDMTKRKVKRAEEKAIFYDIFVKPKEETIKELNEKRKEKNKEAVTEEEAPSKPFISNKLNEKGKIIGMNTTTTKTNITSLKSSTILPTKSGHTEESKTGFEISSPQKDLTATQQEKIRNEDLMKINLLTYVKTDTLNDVSILNDCLHEKFIPHKYSSPNTKNNYFNQLIQIRPPEGINGVVASPLMDSKGWAPSIPSINIDKLNTNLNDLMIRAKGGIKAGDITKEAHMAFYLGIMNEEEKKYENALKFYKKYFLSAKLLQDIYGTELALNRIAGLFSNIFDYNQSIYYNEKHKEITTHNLNGLVAHYNCGVCYRILCKFDESIKNFDTALKMAEEENDFESYTLCLAQLAISYIFTGNVNSFIEYSEEFFNKNKTLNHVKMELEMKMLTGYIYSFCNVFDTAKDYYENGLKKASESADEEYEAIALSNIGIIEANKDIDDFFVSLNGNQLNEQANDQQFKQPLEQQNEDKKEELFEGDENANGNVDADQNPDADDNVDENADADENVDADPEAGENADEDAGENADEDADADENVDADEGENADEDEDPDADANIDVEKE